MVSSFLTTICVFVPLAGIEGRIGRVLQVIPVVLVVVLAVSLIEAFFILPSHLAHSLEPYDPARARPVRARLDAGFERLRERGLGRVVDAAVRHRWGVLGLTIAVFLVSVGHGHQRATALRRVPLGSRATSPSTASPYPPGRR